MARFTQYIGLSNEAKEFLKVHNAKKVGSWKMTTGIGYEDVIGNIYEVPNTNLEGWDDTFAEVEDVSPWSSGPLIHTALRSLKTGEVRFKWKKEEVHWD